MTLSGPDVLVELAHLYSNLLPGPETLAELRDRASARLRPANHAPVRQVQHRLGPARIEELIAAYRRGPPLPPSLFNSRSIAQPSPRYSSGKNRLKELGVSEGAYSLPFAHRLSREWSRRMPDAWSRTCPSGAI